MVQKLERVIEYSLIATIFFLALSPTMTVAALAVSAAAWLIKLKITNGACFKRTPFDKVIAAFIVIGAISIIGSPDKVFSSYNFCFLMSLYMSIYYITIQNIVTMTQLKKIIKALVLSAVLAIGYGYFQYFHGIDVSDMLWVDGEQFPELKTRVFSTMQNPNIFAGYLLTVLCVTFGVFCKIDNVKQKIGLAVFFLAAAVCLGMTYCRGAWLSFAIVMAIYTLRYNRKMFAVLAVAAVGIVLFEPSIQQRLLSAFTVGDTSSEMRLAMWESTVAMVIDNPAFGIGWGAYFLVYPEYDFYINNPAVVIVHAHNMYLNYMAETGILGFTAYMLCMLGHMKMAFSSINLRSSKLLNGIVLGIALSIVCVMINGITDYVLFNIELSMLYWFLNAVIIIICRRGLK